MQCIVCAPRVRARVYSGSRLHPTRHCADSPDTNSKGKSRIVVPLSARNEKGKGKVHQPSTKFNEKRYGISDVSMPLESLFNTKILDRLANSKIRFDAIRFQSASGAQFDARGLP